MEIWKEIPMYPGYEVSTYGQVRSFKQGRNGYILSQRTDKKGYKHVMLNTPEGKKNCQVHRLVMLTFNPCENSSKLEVNHKDENKQNNHLDNLEWLPHADNVRYGTGHQRAIEPLKCLVYCVETDTTYSSMKEASDKTGINYGNISSCCSGRLLTAGGYHWKKITSKRETQKYNNICPRCGKPKGHEAKVCQACKCEVFKITT